MQRGDSIVFKYNTIAGIGLGGVGTATETDGRTEAGNGIPPEGPLQGKGQQEEAFISLLDVVEETKDGDVKPSALPLRAEPLKHPPWGDQGSRVGVQSQSVPSTSGRSLELPWAKSSRQIRSPMVRLHNGEELLVENPIKIFQYAEDSSLVPTEIVEFCRFLEPTKEEKAAREDAIVRVTALVQELFPSCELQIFGSFVTGLYLPTSDMDMVVVKSGCDDIPRALTAIGHLLVEREMAKNIQVVAKAKVPIVKFDDIKTGLAFDISFDVANGPVTASFVSKMMHALPPMRPLVMVLKMFLQQRELNEVYQGGIGSYALLVMVASFLLQHPSRQPSKHHTNPPLEGCLGILLLDFFRLYGRALNMEIVAISCRKGGSYFPKRTRPVFLQRDRPYFLAIEDPNDQSNDLAKGSYNIMRVRQAFDFAYGQLSQPVHPDDSLLERIIRLDAVLISRAPATWQPEKSDSDMEIDPPEDKPRPSPRAVKASRTAERARVNRPQRARERSPAEPQRARERSPAERDRGKHKRQPSREAIIRRRSPPRRKRERDEEFEDKNESRREGGTRRHEREVNGKRQKWRRERSDSDGDNHKGQSRPKHIRFDY